MLHQSPLFKECSKGLFVGGFICAIGQAVSLFILFSSILQRRQQEIQLLQQWCFFHDFNRSWPL